MPSQRLLPATAIREWRHRHRLSQSAAAKACGVHRVTWSQWERDRVAAPHWLAWALSTIDLAETRKTKSVTTSSEDTPIPMVDPHAPFDPEHTLTLPIAATERVRVAWFDWGSPNGYQKYVAARTAREEHFRSLVSAWRDETDGMSNPAQITDSAHYQAIIDMGWYAVPYILQDMEMGGGHWYKALHTITGEWPVKPGDEGHPVRMRGAWLDWGRANGYL